LATPYNSRGITDQGNDKFVADIIMENVIRFLGERPKRFTKVMAVWPAQPERSTMADLNSR
jgi:hypothetical protein